MSDEQQRATSATGTCPHGVAMTEACMTCISRGDDPRGPDFRPGRDRASEAIPTNEAKLRRDAEMWVNDHQPLYTADVESLNDLLVEVFTRGVLAGKRHAERSTDYAPGEREALLSVVEAARAYVPYPAKTFDERHDPRREVLLRALFDFDATQKRSDPETKGNGR